MNQAAMFQLSYGLFVLSAKDGEKDNGCIVNTVQQVTTTPNRISVAVNKGNFTHDMIRDTGSFNKYANAFLSASVAETVDLGTHTMFIADVTGGEVLSQVPSVTYAYYHKHIKPQPQETKKTGWRCKICGYIYEGEDLPADFICPICKHGASDFERIV